jgi:osmoprotectant transport system substrate-binding protein
MLGWIPGVPDWWCPSDTRGASTRGTQKVVHHMKLYRSVAMALAAAGLMVTAACGGDNNSLENSGGSTGSGDKGSLTLGGQDFTEMQIMASMYTQLLSAKGYDVSAKLVTTRDVYIGELSKGNVDVVPDYLAGITDFLNTAKNGDTAESVSTHDPDATLAALKPLAAEKGISMLEPSQATDQNAFFVTQKYADDNNLTTLSDLAALGKPIKLAAPADCEGRSDCQAGLENVYGLTITDIVPLDFASAQMKDAVKKGEVQMGETGTTDGSLADQGFVILEDDKGIQPAQNLIPAVNSDFLKAHPDIADVLNPLSAALTTDDLATMNSKVDLERQKPEEVAKDYLTANDLL